jgi:hypothetical protein
MMLTGGSHLSARGRERGGTGSGAGGAGPWAASGAGPDRFPGAFSVFISPLLLFHFCFLYLFKHFSKLIQIDPNQLCKVSKIQNNQTEQ